MHSAVKHTANGAKLPALAVWFSCDLQGNAGLFVSIPAARSTWVSHLVRLQHEVSTLGVHYFSPSVLSPSSQGSLQLFILPALYILTLLMAE